MRINMSYSYYMLCNMDTLCHFVMLSPLNVILWPLNVIVCHVMATKCHDVLPRAVPVPDGEDGHDSAPCAASPGAQSTQDKP